MGSDFEEEVRSSARRLYASGQPIWDQADRWNARKVREISRFCSEIVRSSVAEDSRVLNAGAGSHRYEWMPAQALWTDRFAAQLAGRPDAVVADLENLPFQDESFDIVICVGSVLNYVSAIEALTELCRVLSKGGRLILHFETSDSLEHLFTKRWRAPVAPLHTVNSGRPDLVWIYSRAFVGRILKGLGMTIEKEHSFHIASAALLRLGVPQQLAALAQSFDVVLRPLGSGADDIILTARKGAQHTA